MDQLLRPASTLRRAGTMGELFDLKEDPQELHNRWSDPAYTAVKSEMLQRFVQVDMGRESTWMPRLADA